MVELNGPVHARPLAGTSGRICRRQRNVSTLSKKWPRHRDLPTCGTSIGKWRWFSAHGWKCAKSWQTIMPSQRRRGRKPRRDSWRRCRGNGGGNNSPPSWREAFAKWSEISNEELIRNQRGDDFLRAQKELLRSGLKLRSRQDDIAEAASAMFGIPGRKDFDEVTRQLTELRREVRALSHKVHAQERSTRSTRPKAGDTVIRSDTQPNTQ